ncbi:hypothetical protein SAY86_022271 [Trapa natans]|uniref:Transmembrane protein n=1 Tax=Trapa natans TaxID=22666 RepID=A0AAN7RDM2_TRANT|nr:hypothetical protein SAY86_022271 [Trapa natans]
MDQISLQDREVDVDLENGWLVEKNEDGASACISSISPNEVKDSKMLSPERAEGGRTPGSTEKMEATKEKHKKTSRKKPPRPPRPPRGPSLDSADHKLIKEIAELAMLKKARSERMKALKKAKNSKTSSSSNNAVLAMAFTIIFFLIVIFQGISPKLESPLVSLQGPSPEAAGRFTSVQYYPSSSVNYMIPPDDASHNLVEKVAVPDARKGPSNRVVG